MRCARETNSSGSSWCRRVRKFLFRTRFWHLSWLACGNIRHESTKYKSRRVILVSLKLTPTSSQPADERAVGRDRIIPPPSESFEYKPRGPLSFSYNLFPNIFTRPPSGYRYPFPPLHAAFVTSRVNNEFTNSSMCNNQGIVSNSNDKSFSIDSSNYIFDRSMEKRNSRIVIFFLSFPFLNLRHDSRFQPCVVS